MPAKITKLAQFGAFAELEPGVEGLVHISELSDERITHPKQVVREGEDVSLRIIKIDPQRHRLGLSLRQAEDGGEYGYSGGGFEEWGPSSYALGGSSTATATAESENGEEVEPVHQPEEPADSVHALPSDQSEEAAAERAANGTARVPEH